MFVFSVSLFAPRIATFYHRVAFLEILDWSHFCGRNLVEEFLVFCFREISSEKIFSSREMEILEKVLSSLVCSLFMGDVQVLKPFESTEFRGIYDASLIQF